jgi:hypothetical protein
VKRYVVMLALLAGAVMPMAALAGQTGQSRKLLDMDGNKMRVTLVAVAQSFTGFDHDFDAPKSGMRYFGLRFAVQNLSTHIIDECNDNDVLVSKSNGVELGTEATILASGDCYHLLPHHTTYQWTYMLVPKGAKVSLVNFIPSSQNSDSVGEWKV